MLDMCTINIDAQVTWIYNQQKQQTLHTLKGTFDLKSLVMKGLRIKYYT